MKKKKCLAWFVSDLKTLGGKITSQKFIIEKICNSFDKLYIVNTENLRFLKNANYFFENTKNIYSKKDFLINKKNSKLIMKNKNLKLPNNVEFFNPLNSQDFKNFMIDKDIVIINSFGRNLNELKIHFLLNNYNIKQIQISNFGNLQGALVPVKNLNLMAWINKLIHDSGHFFIVILSSLGLVPKIDIRFISNKKIVNGLKKGFKSYIFSKLNIFYYKKHIMINSKSYDLLFSDKPRIKNEKIVLLDIMLNHPEYIQMGSKSSAENTKKFYYKINKLLNYLSKAYKKKVVVCIHPKDNLKKKKQIFKNYEVVKYASQKNILKSFIVLFFDTSAIVDAIMLKKKIIFIKSRLMGKNSINFGMDYHKRAGVFKLDLENYKIENKEKFLNILNKSKEKYSDYIKSYLAPDGKNLGYEKIVKTIKRNFFN